MRKSLFAASAALAIAAASPAAHANIVTPGGSVTPDLLPDCFSTATCTAAASTSGTFTSNLGASDFSGNFTEDVAHDPNNHFGAGDLTFFILVSNNASSGQDVDTVSASSFTGFSTDVGNASPPVTSGTDPSTVGRTSSGSAIDFNFASGLVPGKESEWLIIQTNATNFTAGNLGMINNGVASVGAFEPTTVPEPATWAMMLLGFAGLGFAGFRARKTSISIA